jgi:hypothetical protein
MKCISLQQPWATLVVIGAKHFETRDWHTSYIGDLAIHASQRFAEEARALCAREPFRSALARAGYRQSADLPTGAVVGHVELVECLPVATVLTLLQDTPEELAFGDYRNARWAWRLVGPRRLLEPKRCRGHLGLFDVPIQRLMF